MTNLEMMKNMLMGSRWIVAPNVDGNNLMIAIHRKPTGFKYKLRAMRLTFENGYRKNTKSRKGDKMSKSYYSDYVNHSLRFYARYKEPVFKSEVDRLKWESCDKAFENLDPKFTTPILEIYSQYDGFNDNVQRACIDHDIPVQQMWDTINTLEREVAKNRGLI